ncbi:MAG: MFS transporter [Thermoplasmata archaeon]
MDRDYRVMLAASGLNTAVTAMLYASLQFLAYEKGHSLIYVGLVGALPYIGMMVMAYVWGLLSDWLGKRRDIVIITGALGSLLFFVYPWLTTIEQLLAIRFVQVCLMGSIILLLAVVTERFPAEKGRVIGDINVPLSLGWMVGAAVAAFLYRDHTTELWALCGIVGLASALVLVPLKEESKAAGLRPMLTGMLTFRNKRQIGLLCAATLVLLIGNYMVYSVFAQYLRTPDFGLSEFQIGLLVAGSGLTGVLVVRFAGELADLRGRRGIFLGTIVCYAASWTLYALTTNIYVVGLLWMLPYWSFFVTSSTAIASDLTSEEERGRGIGILNAAINSGNVAGSILGGLAAEVLGYRPAFGIAAALVTVSFFIALGVRESNSSHSSGSTPAAPPER